MSVSAHALGAYGLGLWNVSKRLLRRVHAFFTTMSKIGNEGPKRCPHVDVDGIGFELRDAESLISLMHHGMIGRFLNDYPDAVSICRICGVGVPVKVVLEVARKHL